MKLKSQDRSKLLRIAFARAQKENPKFSLRSLALKLKLSPAFVSKVLNGKAELPLERVPSFCKALKMDEVSAQVILRTFQPEGLVDTRVRSRADGPIEELGSKSDQILDHWYYIAILDLLSCAPHVHKPVALAERLGLTVSQVEAALQFLKSQGYIAATADGGFRKTKEKVRFPTTMSREKIRKYHAQMMKKATDVLNQQTRDEDFQKRLIAGISIAGDSKKIEAIRTKLHELMYELAEEFADGEADQVYHLGFQFFPVSKS